MLSHSLKKRQRKDFFTVTHIHLFENPVAQDAAVAAEILTDVCKNAVKEHTKVKKIHFQSDNAGLYKSTFTMAMLDGTVKDHLVTYNYCEAQNGKVKLHCYHI